MLLYDDAKDKHFVSEARELLLSRNPNEEKSERHSVNTCIIPLVPLD